MVYYDENGDPVEGALSPEDAKALQEQVALAEAEKAKLADKDKNFEALRKSKEGAEGEKAEMAQRLEALEKQRVEDLERANKDIEASKAKLLKTIAGDDADMQKKIEDKLNRFKQAENLDEYEANIREAQKIIYAEEGRRINPINAFIPGGSGSQSNFHAGTNKQSSDNVIGLARELGLNKAFDTRLFPKDTGGKFIDSISS